MSRNRFALGVFTQLAISVLLVFLVFPVSAQHAGGAPRGVVFYSTRDDHPNNQIYIMNPDGTSQVRMTYDTASDVDPDFSPDSEQIVFTSNQTESGANNIFLRDRTNDAATDEWARWSPDGRQIVFDSNREGIFEIYVMNADGTGVTRLTDPPMLGRYPSWSPDGKQIVFRRSIGDPCGWKRHSGSTDA